jgi:hypothetical protein
VSSNIITDLKSKNLTVEEINGNNSFETSLKVSDKIIEIQRARNITINSTYIGFGGELPSIIPLIVKDKALLIEDPTNHVDEMVSYLKKNKIKNVVITRNSDSSYLQMEEPDYVSTKVADNLKSNGIETSYLTNFRTVNEATGLYETTMISTELLFNNTTNQGDQISNVDDKLTNGKITISQYPPLIDITLKGGVWKSNTGNLLSVNQIGLNQWSYVWKGIHPYTWKNNSGSWYCSSNSIYNWNWSEVNNTWTVNYLSNGNPYYKVYWVKKGELWEEIHDEGSYDWRLIGNSWICTNNDTNESFILCKQTFWA